MMIEAILLAAMPLAQEGQCPRIWIEGSSFDGTSGLMIVEVMAEPDPQGVEAILWQFSAGELVKEDGQMASVAAPKGTEVTAKVELGGMTPESCDPTAQLTFIMP